MNRWVEVGDGVLARRHAELDLTTGLVIGAERALVVDTRGDAVQGAELLAAVRAVTALPLVVALTHAHFDHCFGTAAFLPAPVHALPGCRPALAATAAAQRTEWAAHYRARGDAATAAALAATDPVLPDPAPPALDLGGRHVDLLDLGRGHTDHDLVVHVPDAGVVLAGDLVEQGAPPSIGPDAVVPEWPATLDRLLALGGALVVPGHGDPVDVTFVRAQRAELAEVARLWSAVARGDLDAVTADRRAPLPDVPWPVPSGPAPRATSIAAGVLHHATLLYDSSMSAEMDVNISEAREHLADVVDRARAHHRPVFLSRRGRRVAAVIDADDLERLIELAEDMADLRAAEAARAEMRDTGETPIPWDEVKKDLGL